MVTITLVVAGAGLLGGIVTSLLAGQFQLPQLDKNAGVFRPGWIGNAVVGAVAALVIWGLYGPLATTVLLGEGANTVKASLRVADLMGAIVTGIGGSRILSAEVDKRLLAKAKEDLRSSLELLNK